MMPSGLTERVCGTVVRAHAFGVEVFFFVINPEDTIGRFHYAGEFYELEELNMISRFYLARGLFVDIGANVGNHSIYASRILGAPRVLAFEPNPVAISVLDINLRLNSCTNVDTRYLGLALGDGDGQFEAITPKESNLGHTVLVPSLTGTIQCTTGDRLLFNEEVEFIKIDVEGMELQILTGLQKTIERWKPKLFVEVWEGKKDAFLQWCKRSDYQVADQYQRYEGIMNFLLMPREGARSALTTLHSPD
jgi:FkbM family methyltransferase